MLSLDVGRRRIGLAGCDGLGLTVSPLPALHRGAHAQNLHYLQTLCHQRNVQGLVVGVPLDDQGQLTDQAHHCRRYGRRIARDLGLPLAFVNEHSSSWAAADRHGLQGDRSGRLDSAAAALLLEQWLAEGPDVEPVNAAPDERGGNEADEGSCSHPSTTP